MLAQSHIVAYRKLGDWTKLKDMSIARIAKGERSENGFPYLEDIDISIQRRSANKSWEAIKHLAFSSILKHMLNFFGEIKVKPKSLAKNMY